MAKYRNNYKDFTWDRLYTDPMKQMRHDLRYNASKENLMLKAAEYHDLQTIKAIFSNRNCDHEVKIAVFKCNNETIRYQIVNELYQKLDSETETIIAYDRSIPVRRSLADKTTNQGVLLLLLRSPEKTDNKEIKIICCQKINIRENLGRIKNFLKKVSNVPYFKEYVDALLRNPKITEEDIKELLTD